VSLFLQDVEAPHVAAGGSEVALAQKNLNAIELLLGLRPLIDVLFRAHVEEAIRRSRVARTSQSPYHTFAMAIGFVDLVGFTPLADQLSPAELGRLVGDFEARAYDAVAEHGGRVVKLIGDEVMFVAVDAEAACRAALALISGFRDGGRATPRGAVAFGDLVIRGGDYYGPLVNLAARLAELAVPSELLVTPEVASRAPGVAFVPAGRRMPKGFTTPVELLSAAT
jgi:adenylate cyclase